MAALFRLAWRTLSVHRLRTALTAAAIGLGVATVLAAATIGQAAGRQAEALSSQGGMSNTLLVQAGLFMAGALLLLAASFTILNAFGMSLSQRTRELGMLRAVGMTRGQVRGMVLAEAALLGLGGALAGVVMGVALSWAIMQANGSLRQVPYAVSRWGLAGAPLAGLAVTVVGALQPAWVAGRVPPLAAIRARAEIESGHRPRWSKPLGVGLLVLAAASAVGGGLIGRPVVTVAVPAVVGVQAVLLAGAMLLVPGLIDPLAAACGPLLARWLGPAGQIAAGSLGRRKLRAALTAGAMAAGLAAVVANSALMTAGLKGSLLRLGSMLHEDAFAVNDISHMIRSGELTVDNFFQFISADDPRYSLDAAMAALEPLVQAGVLRVERNRFVPAAPELVALPGSPAVAVDMDVFLDIGNYVFYEGDAATAAALMASGQAVLLQPLVAERLGMHAGDSVTVQTSLGPSRLTVAGVGGCGWNMPVLSFADATALVPGGPTHLGIVSVARDPAGVASALDRARRALAAAAPGVGVFCYDNNLAPMVQLVDRLEALLNGLMILAVVVSALGVVNSVAANAAERRGEIGLLRAVGATRRQVWRSIVAEAALLGLLAALVAAGLGLLMLLAWVALVLPNGTGSIGVRPDWETVRMVVLPALRDWALAAAAALLAGPLVAATAAYWPARIAAAASIVEATRAEG